MSLTCLALACSPRRNGNTSLLAARAIDECRAAGCHTEFLHLAGFRFEPCRACGACNKTGRCIIDDDARVIFDKILAADRLILAAPVYSMGINAQAKMLIDRAQQFWAAKYVLGKSVINHANRPARRGIFISCAGTRLPGVFDGTIRVAKYFFKMLEIEMLAALCYDGTDQPGAVLENNTALDEVADYGRRLCR